MAAPVNIDAANAIDLGSLPASVMQDVHDAGTTYEVWYKYTAVGDEKVIGLFGFGDLTTYKPRIRVYSDLGVTLLVDTTAATTSIGISRNKAVQVPVLSTNPTAYYFRFTPNTGDPTPAILNIDLITGPTQGVPAGSIAVNDDTGGFPLALLSAVDGDDNNVLRFINLSLSDPFPNGEAGDILPDGTLFIADSANSNQKLFDKDYNLIATVALNPGSTISLRANPVTELFYTRSSGSGTIRQVDKLGNITNSWSIPEVGAPHGGIAPANDDSILYYATDSTSGSAIKKWDLVADSGLSDLAPIVTDYRVCDIFVLADDSIIVGYIHHLGTRHVQVKHYSAAGATLHTYDLGFMAQPSGVRPRMARALDDPNSFWIWTHLQGANDYTGFSKFRNVKISDGSILAEIEYVEYEKGVYQPAETDTPLSRFGNSFSCPFWITQSAIEVPPGTIIVGKVTDPFDGTTSFPFVAGGGLSPTDFSLLSEEEEEFLDVPVGDGYSIIETPVPAGWGTPIYLVSNGSPNTNISVASGEEVTVMVLNRLRAPDSGLFTPTPDKPTDTKLDGDGNPIEVEIPNPFVITGFLVDK